MIVGAYADGGIIGRNPSPIGGTFAWCHVDEAGERVRVGSGMVLPGDGDLPDLITNNVTEFAALVCCLEALPDGWSGPVHSDSRVTLWRLFHGWKMTGVPWSLVSFGSRALCRLGTLTPVLLDGHPTKAQLAAGVGKRGGPVSPFNVWCDTECQRLAASTTKGDGR